MSFPSGESFIEFTQAVCSMTSADFSLARVAQNREVMSQTLMVCGQKTPSAPAFRADINCPELPHTASRPSFENAAEWTDDAWIPRRATSFRRRTSQIRKQEPSRIGATGALFALPVRRRRPFGEKANARTMNKSRPSSPTCRRDLTSHSRTTWSLPPPPVAITSPVGDHALL